MTHEEEAIDIDLTDPDVEAAATKIQAGFKGHKTRKEMQSKKEADNEDKNDNVPEISVEAGTPRKAADEEEEVDIDLEDPEVEAAATKIQAGFKGHKARKQLKEQKATIEIEEEGGVGEGGSEAEAVDIDLKEKEDKKEEEKKEEEKEEKKEEEKEEKKEEAKEEEIDIDLTDPDVEAAATKIQAMFRGWKARKQYKSLHEEQYQSLLDEGNETNNVA